jgi:hypothetical protein
MSLSVNTPVQILGTRSSLLGCQDGLTFLEGLWYGNDALGCDMATVTRRLRLLGYNAVRLPFGMQELFAQFPKYKRSQGLCSVGLKIAMIFMAWL